jgi:hypothetical protein
VVKKPWEGWKVFVRIIDDAQAMVILGVVCFVLRGPLAPLPRLGADPFGRRPGPGSTYWRPRPPEVPALDTAWRQ